MLSWMDEFGITSIYLYFALKGFFRWLEDNIKQTNKCIFFFNQAIYNKWLEKFWKQVVLFCSSC